MSHKQSKRLRKAAKERGYVKPERVLNSRRLIAPASRSKYQPHYGAKESAKFAARSV